MVSILFRLFLLILLLWLLRRFFAALIRAPRQAGRVENSANSPKATSMVKDPVCGMYMDSRLAVRLENRNGTYYFCSDACKSKFIAKPGKTDTGGTHASL